MGYERKLYNNFYFGIDSDLLTLEGLLLIPQEASTEAFGITCTMSILLITYIRVQDFSVAVPACHL